MHVKQKSIQNRSFEKNLLNINEQLKLLKERGLRIDNEERAKFFLEHISYYHFSVYFRFFQKKDDYFKKGTCFEDVFRIYKFDKKLRVLILELLERVEMSFKSVLINKIDGDEFWYTRDDFFQDEFKYIHQDILKDFKKPDKPEKESKEIYIKSFHRKYVNEYVPVWMFFEKISFGQSVMIYRNLVRRQDQLKVVNHYGFLSEQTTINIFHILSLLRNVCAHHARLWNRRAFVSEVRNFQEYEEFLTTSKKTLFDYLLVMQVALSRISPRSNWVDKLEILIKEYDIDINRMGFPENWKDVFLSLGAHEELHEGFF